MNFSFGPRHILYFTAEERSLYRCAGTALELQARFAADDAGLAAFQEHLRGERGALFAVVADLAGEDFHEEQIPLVRGSDREALVGRRLAQRYRDTRLALALTLGNVTTPERRNERVLLASFTNTQQLAPWLDALEQAGTRLAGVYSVPLLAPMLATKLAPREKRTLIVTVNRAGLRQCYVENGRLRFGRLERIAELAPEALAAFVRSETQRLLQYLITLRALPREGAAVQVLVVAPDDQRMAFEQALSSDARLVFRTINHADARRAIRLRRVPQGMAGEALYVHLAAHKPPRDQFASREDRRRYLLWQLQRGTVAAGVAAFGICAVVAGNRWLDAAGMRRSASEQITAAREAAQQYERITSTFPVTDTTTDNLKVAVVEFQRIAERSADPERAFVHISQVLERYPQFELDSLRWTVGRAAELRDTGLKAQPAEGPGTPDAAAVIEVSGRVNATQRNDYRAITGQVQAFAASLASGGYELVRTQLPFDITSEGVLTGDIGEATESGEAPRFTVTVARRLP